MVSVFYILTAQVLKQEPKEDFTGNENSSGDQILFPKVFLLYWV